MDKSTEGFPKFKLIKPRAQQAFFLFLQDAARAYFGSNKMIEIYIKHYKEEFKPTQILTRRAVRAIVINNGKLLMIKSNKNGDYKFPGGGIEEAETEEEALIREVKEESGYEIKNIMNLVFSVFEESQEKNDPRVLFRMNSKYYLCDVGNIRNELKLDKYEEELGFEPIWVDSQEALNTNIEVIKNGIVIKWIKREIRILEEIIKRNFPKTTASN